LPALRLSLLAVIASAAFSGAVCPAQSPAPCTPGVKSYIGIPVIKVLSVPYSATQVVSFDQRMTDGNTIHGVTRLFNARDSGGKIRMESSVGCFRDKSGQPYDRTLVRVNDPYAGTLLDWYIGGPAAKVAHLQHRPEFFGMNHPDKVWKNSVTTVKVPGLPAEVDKFEVLGTKFIGNILVEGFRSTESIPAGARGNAEPIVVTSEGWVAKQLGITISLVIDDPSRGHTEMTLENLTFAEPDPTVFALPEGYRIVDSSEDTDVR